MTSLVHDPETMDALVADLARETGLPIEMARSTLGFVRAARSGWMISVETIQHEVQFAQADLWIARNLALNNPTLGPNPDNIHPEMFELSKNGAARREAYMKLRASASASLRSARQAAEAATWFQRQDRDVIAAKKIELDESQRLPETPQEAEEAAEQAIFDRVEATTRPRATEASLKAHAKRLRGNKQDVMRAAAEVRAEFAELAGAVKPPEEGAA